MLVLALWQRIFRNENPPQLDLDIAAISDLFGVAHHFGIFFTPVVDDVARVSQMQFEIFQSHSLVIAEKRTSADAQQNLVRVLIGVRQVVPIASYHHLDIQFFGQLDQAFVNLSLDIPVSIRFRVAVILQL